jgi:transcriptional coactivator p15 (PC4)
MDAGPTTIGTIEKNYREHVVISLSEFRGHQLVDVRVHAGFHDGDERRPIKKGISIKVERLPELIAVLQGAARKAIELGLIGDNEGKGAAGCER